MRPALHDLALPFPEAPRSFSHGLSSCSVVSVLRLQSVFLGNEGKREHIIIFSISLAKHRPFH